VPVGTRTTHGPIEYGKDVVAWHPRQRVLYLFQLKAGDIKRADWPDLLRLAKYSDIAKSGKSRPEPGKNAPVHCNSYMRDSIDRQLYELANVPYSHPNYPADAPSRPVLVCTGQVDPTVQDAITKQNQSTRGTRAVAIWDREILISAFRDQLFSVQVLSESVAVDHIRVWSHASDYGTDEEGLYSFLKDYLGLAQGHSGRDLRRILAGYVVAVAQLSQRYSSKADVYSAVDCAVLGMVVFYEAIVRRYMTSSVAGFYCDALRTLLAGLLQGLHEDFESDPTALADLTDKHAGPEEIFVLPLRVHSLASKLSLYAFLGEYRGDAGNSGIGLVDRIVRGHSSFTHIISERQAGTLVVTLLALIRYGFHDTARDALVETLKWVVGLHGYPGAPGLPDPYQPLADIPFHFLGLRARTSRPQTTRPGDASYLLPVLVRLACLLGQRGVLERTWPLLSRTMAEEYLPEAEAEMYSRRSEHGESHATLYPPRQSWRRLRRQCLESRPANYLALGKRYPEALLILSLAYPWRAPLCEPSLYIRERTVPSPGTSRG